MSSAAALPTIDVPAAVRAILENEGKPLGDLVPPDHVAFLADGGYVYVVGPFDNGDVFARVKAKGCQLLGIDGGDRH